MFLNPPAGGEDGYLDFEILKIEVIDSAMVKYSRNQVYQHQVISIFYPQEYLIVIIASV